MRIRVRRTSTRSPGSPSAQYLDIAVLGTLFAIFFTLCNHRYPINGLNSPSIPLARGTRQGCPLSTILFDLALDLLLRHHHIWTCFSGIAIATEEIRVSAFADDHLLFISTPHAVLPDVLREIESKGKLLGFSINLEKSGALMLTAPARPLWSS